ncbi:MAG: 4-hydroxythreonine-4-phosphate dehydrogenase PdxA [Flavobacteriaceae bacterium]|nr:4-hydroxythreonine-4-phosphate dehydrogenase PdxA [Flavobacteriaceae bacterium]
MIDIVTGDGELITLDIINNNIRESPLVSGLNRRVFKVDSSSKYYVKDIDKLELERDFFKNEPVIHPLGFNEANIVTSRGCVYNCSFCAAAYSQNKVFGIRERTIKSVQLELAQIQKELPQVNSIRVLDDLFLKSKKHVLTATQTFNPYKFKWRSMAHVLTFNNISNSDLIKLKKSGCEELFIGIESGSPRILKSINKTNKVDLIIKNLSAVLRVGIDIKAYFIYGFPKESLKDMEKTYYLAQKLEGDSLMFMVTEHLKVGLLTDHVPVKDITEHITEELINNKIDLIYNSLIKDFKINKPRIAVLGINPHAGDNGVIGKEDDNILKPTLEKIKNSGKLVYGPYSADSFFGSDNYKNFHAVIASYHDQGLIPFKTITFGEGVNFTAGLSKVRTSPDHGPAYEIAGKNIADATSFKEAVFTAIKIFRNREEHSIYSKSPLKVASK